MTDYHQSMFGYYVGYGVQVLRGQDAWHDLFLCMELLKDKDLFYAPALLDWCESYNMHYTVQTQYWIWEVHLDSHADRESIWKVH